MAPPGAHARTSSSPPSGTAIAATPARHREADALGTPDRAPPHEDLVAFDVAIATHAPISLGVEANLRLPLGILVRTHFGFMPEPYIGVINGVATGLGAYDSSVAALVDRSGANAFVMRLSGGIRPVPGYGFEILAGYTMISASARASVRDFEQATGQSMPGMESVGIAATLHAFHVELGWSALVWDHLVIRGSIGWMHTLASDARVDTTDDMRRRAGGRIEDIETDVREALTSYGFSPEVRIGVGYQF
ncbi:MAG: hypothetical protein M3Y87_17910 [Myxococcota bacterium]|nr:hypothetical protein [Myxococcota bacterium]